jgi:hypothetical protein
MLVLFAILSGTMQKMPVFRCLCWACFQLEACPTRRGVSFLLLLDPLNSPGRWLERIGKVLRLVGNLAIAKLHNADCLRWLLVIAENVLGDPEIVPLQCHQPQRLPSADPGLFEFPGFPLFIPLWLVQSNIHLM